MAIRIWLVILLSFSHCFLKGGFDKSKAFSGRVCKFFGTMAVYINNKELMMKFLLIAFLLCIFSVSATDEKGSYAPERYFPVSWEPPTVRTIGNVVVVSPSKPNFERPSSLGNHIEVDKSIVEKSKKIEDVIYRIIVDGKVKRIYVGKIFLLAKKRFRFLGVEKGNFVIQDLKTKEKVVFTKTPPKKKKEMKK